MEYIFYQGLDSVDGDIARVKMDAESYPETLNTESLPPNLRGIPCFNTLGYLKGKVGELKPSQYFSPKDGVYIKNVLNEIPIKIINLDRRPDRWERTKELLTRNGINNIERFSAVDGTKLEMSDQIKHLFRGNDFQYRQGFIGCALSHIQLWEQLVKSDKDHFLIFEDDIELVDEFKKKLNVVYNNVLQNPFNDVTFLGYFFWQGKAERKNEYPDLKVMQSKTYMGGFYSYIISKSGALKLLNQIKLYGVQNGIDRFMHLHFDKMQIFHTEPHLVHSDFVQGGNTVDSDIQRNVNPVGVKTPKSFDANSITTPVLPKNPLDSEGSKTTTVKLITNWTTSKDLVKYWNKMSQDGNGKWNSIQITDSNDADYFAIINKPGPPEYYNPKKTMVFQMEPWVNDETKNWGVKTWGKWSNPDPKVFWKILTHKYHHNLGEWHLNKTYKELQSVTPEKNKIISTFVSDKNFDEGHIKRLSFLKFIEEKEFEIDIFGKGSLDYKNGKGPVEFKDEGLFPYKYTICVENNSEHNYITEKLYDGILAECLCFYWGAPNVTDYIDNEAIILLDLNDFEKSYETIKNAIENNEREKRLDAIQKAKAKILNEMNVFACLEKVIKSNETQKETESSTIEKTKTEELPVKKIKFNKEKAFRESKTFKKIAFLDNKLSLRGTSVAIYDYADYNEKILGNESIIFTRDYDDCKNEMDTHIKAYEKFNERFKVFYYRNIKDIENIIEKENIDILYIIKYGRNDGLVTNKCKTLIHCVFDSRYAHGDVYATISERINEICGTNHPVLPHIVNVYDTNEDFRQELNIPEKATVFGIFGGETSFNIDYMRKAVVDISKNELGNVYFVFLNIPPPCELNSRIRFLEGTTDMKIKRMFINSCDAMLYGRDIGETFGLCIGEFSLCDKPIILRNKPHDNFKGHFDTFHLQTLGEENIIVHNNYAELIEILTKYSKYNKNVSKNGYKKYTPENVMKIFNQLIS